MLYATLVFLCGIVLDMVKAHLAMKRDGNKQNIKGADSGSVEFAEVEFVEAKQSGVPNGVTARDTTKAIAAALAKHDNEIAALKREVARLLDERSEVGTKV
jgi:hypothetical protein